MNVGCIDFFSTLQYTQIMHLLKSTLRELNSHLVVVYLVSSWYSFSVELTLHFFNVCMHWMHGHFDSA